MTPSQLDVLAQAPCTSTMVGFGPWSPAVTAGLTVRADAVCPRGTSSAAEAAAVAAAVAASRLSRNRVRRRARVMFTEAFLGWVTALPEWMSEALRQGGHDEGRHLNRAADEGDVGGLDGLH